MGHKLQRDEQGKGLVSVDTEAYHRNKSTKNFQDMICKRMDRIEDSNKKIHDKLNHILNMLHTQNQEKE